MLDLASIFQQAGYEWTFTDGTRIPNAEEIEKTIKGAAGLLAPEPENAQIEVGRLIIKKREGFIDVFLHVGEQPVA
jgi:hypothetical protein